MTKKYLEHYLYQQYTEIKMGWFRNLLGRRKRTATNESFQTAKSSLLEQEINHPEYEVPSKNLLRREFGFNDSCELEKLKTTGMNEAGLQGSHATSDQDYRDEDFENSIRPLLISQYIRETPSPSVSPSKGVRPTKSYLSSEQAYIADQLANSLGQMHQEVALINRKLARLID